MAAVAKVFFFRKCDVFFKFPNLQKKKFQITILNLKFKFPANNSKQKIVPINITATGFEEFYPKVHKLLLDAELILVISNPKIIILPLVFPTKFGNSGHSDRT